MKVFFTGGLEQIALLLVGPGVGGGDDVHE